MSLLATLILASASLPAQAQVAAATVSTPMATATASAQPVAVRGKMLMSSTGSRLAPIYRVNADGSAQIIIEGRMKTVPASTLAMAGGKLTTTLTKREVVALR